MGYRVFYLVTPLREVYGKNFMALLMASLISLIFSKFETPIRGVHL